METLHVLHLIQPFKDFVTYYRELKTRVFSGTSVPLSTFYFGARLGPVSEIEIQSHSEAISSGEVVEVAEKADTRSTDRVHGKAMSAYDVVMSVTLVIGEKRMQCNEVIRCSLGPPDAEINRLGYDQERGTTANSTSDVFLLITAAKISEQFDLPPRCGLVSKDEFGTYFGPFASRAYRSLAESLGISAHEVLLISSKNRRCREIHTCKVLGLIW